MTGAMAAAEGWHGRAFRVEMLVRQNQTQAALNIGVPQVPGRCAFRNHARVTACSRSNDLDVGGRESVAAARQVADEWLKKIGPK